MSTNDPRAHVTVDVRLHVDSHVNAGTKRLPTSSARPSSPSFGLAHSASLACPPGTAASPRARRASPARVSRSDLRFSALRTPPYVAPAVSRVASVAVAAPSSVPLSGAGAGASSSRLRPHHPGESRVLGRFHQLGWASFNACTRVHSSWPSHTRKARVPWPRKHCPARDPRRRRNINPKRAGT